MASASAGSVLTAEELRAAMAVVRREGPAALGQPQRTVLRIDESYAPLVFRVDLGDEWRQDLLVLDGHVVTGHSLALVARYLKRIRFLERRTLSTDNLVAVLERWGEPPPGFSHSLDNSVVPDGEHEPPGLTCRGGVATLTIYALWSPPSPANLPELTSGLPSGVAPRRWLRARLRIDPSYNLRWMVHRRDDHAGARWRPYL